MASSSTLPWLTASAPKPVVPPPSGTNSFFPTVKPNTGLAGTFSSPKRIIAPTPTPYQPIAPTVIAPTTQNQPMLPPIDNSNAFSLNTSNATSNHMSGNDTPDTVSAYRNQLQQNFEAYHAAQQPLQNLYSSTTAFSPQETAAMGDVLNLNSGLRSGINNIRSRPEPLEFQQGQEAALTRDTAIRQQAAADTLGTLDTIRQNNLQAINSQIGFNQQNYQNQFDVNTTAQNFGLQNAQLGVSQQSANQGRYDYQQITDPNTGFPVIQVTDKQTGLPAGTISPSSTAGQTILQNINAQGGTTNTGTTGTATNGNAIVQNTMQMMGATQDMPVSQAISTLGINNIVKGLIGQEGGSPKGVINNPGNILFVGQPGAVSSGVLATDSGRPFASFSTPQAGVTAVANLVNGAAQKGANLTDFIASYKGVTNAPTSGGQSQTPSYDAQIQSLIAAAPVQIKNGIKQLPDGTPYIDGSQIQSQYLPIANSYSAKTGVRVLSANDATAIDSAKQAITNMQAYAATFSALAPSNFGGKLGNAITNPISRGIGTDYGSQLKAFQSNRDGLLQQIRTLAGSSPRLNANELNLAANALPQLGGLGSDTAKDGANKLTLTAQYLDNAIRALDPNYIGTPISIGNQFAVRLSDGVTHYYSNKDKAMQALQLNK